MKAIFAVFATVLAILAWSHPAAAQRSDGKMPRIGYLSYHPDERHKLFAAFQQGLKDLGYVAGKNIVIEQRHAEGKRRRVPALIAELLRLDPDIIVAGAQGAAAAKRANGTIPIVMTFSADPVRARLIASLMHSLTRSGSGTTGSVASEFMA